MPFGRGERWFVVFAAVLVVLHFWLRLGFGLGRLAPDLLVIALLLAAREMRGGAAAALGLAFGFLDDSVVPYTIGTSAISLTLLGYLGSRSREVFSNDNTVLLAGYLFAGKWIYDALVWGVTALKARPDGAMDLLVLSPVEAVYAAAVGLLAFATYRSFAT